MTQAPQIARLVIIGDEILTGKVVDANGPWLLGRLRRIGVRCAGMVVVPDQVPAIADAVRRAAGAADVVFTTGGVGPTHDDCTMKGVAAAFDVPLEAHPKLLELIDGWGEPTPARRRMAMLPAGAEVVPGHRFPQVRFRNVWILPGVPELMRRKFDAIAGDLVGTPPACAAIRTMQRESEIAEHLEATCAAFPDVAIGSYPRWDDPECRVLITLEALDADSVRKALDDLAGRLEPALLRGLLQEYRPEPATP